MLCFRDMSFCSSDCTNKLCRRHFDEKDQKEAVAWWGSPEPPIAFADFSAGCKDYTPPQKETK